MVTNDGSTGKVSTISARCDDAGEAADIESAISMAGFGTFNVLLFLAALPIAWAGVLDTTTTAFILASAECDLQLSFLRKGIATAAPFLGMALTSFLWDYLTPFIGTRNLFVLALLADSVLNVLSSAVESYPAFLAIKILSGILAGGPLSMVVAYLCEFHSAKYKATFVRWEELLINAAFVLAAIVAFLILPAPLTIDVFNRRYPPWRIYLLLCSAVPVLGLATAAALPQTPRYLVEIGKPEEALRLLRRIYSVNKRKPANAFPIKSLRGMEQATPPYAGHRPASLFRPVSEKVRLACYNAKLLFSSPYLSAVAYLVPLQFVSMLGFNTMRLWVPYLFIVLNNFDNENWIEDRRPTICEMLDRRRSVPAREYPNCPDWKNTCISWNIVVAIYQNSAIIAFSAVVFSFLVGTVSTTKLRKRAILLAALLLAAVSSFGTNWAQFPPYMLTLAAAVIVTTRVAGNVVTGTNADLIPLPSRSTSARLLVTVGHVAAVVGNVAFSALLHVECLAAFIGMGSLLLACFCLSFFHPKPVRTSEKRPDRSNA